jgi:hypothetical protein
MNASEQAPEPHTEPTEPAPVRKAVIFVLSAVATGLVSSAVWSEIAPPRGWSHKWLLEVITFGLTKRRNAIFQEAARGLREQSSDALLYIFTFLAFLAFTIGWAFLKWKVLGPPPKSRKQPIRTPATQRRILYGFLLVIVASFTAAVVDIQNKMFAHALTLEFRQDVTLLKPYLDVQKVERLEADFAGMRNEGDLEKIEDQLRDVAMKNHIELPDPYNVMW